MHPERREIIAIPDKRGTRRLKSMKANRKLEITDEHLFPIEYPSAVACVDGLLVFLPEVAPDAKPPFRTRISSISNSYAQGTRADK